MDEYDIELGDNYIYDDDYYDYDDNDENDWDDGQDPFENLPTGT